MQMRMTFAVMNWHEYFAYDAATGNLIWKPRPREMSKNERSHGHWNTMYSGRIAGHAQHKGAGTAVYVRVHNKMYRAHRIVWEMHNGPIPKGVLVDHINGNYEDNRKENLRLANQMENGRNRFFSKRNKFDVKGVNYDATRNKFVSQIRKPDGKTLLRRFPLKCLAASANAKASLMYHGKFSPYYRKAALSHAGNQR